MKQGRYIGLVVVWAGILLAGVPAGGRNVAMGVVTELWARGYSVMPTPQQVSLEAGDVVLNAGWALRLDGVGQDDIAVRTLCKELQVDHGLGLSSDAQAKRAIVLAVRAGAVDTGGEELVQQQGYVLRAGPELVEIVGNSGQGLFYGVQTLLQLVRAGRHGLELPAGTIRDWPDYGLRMLHWDTKHHQDRMEVLKRYLDWSAKFKINAIAFELEDKFEYPSHPVIGAPGAFSTDQMRELVGYGLARHIQIIPDVQGPAHMCYVLKHPEFAHLRSDGSNYQSCMCQDEAVKLIFDMYSDVIEATPGVEYFLVSTDEVYYAGIDPRCKREYDPVNRSLVWAEFVNKAHEFVSQRGRRMLLWVEYPLLPEHVHLLPADVIDGVLGHNEAMIEAENTHGIRQLVYVSMQGEEKLFPNNFAYEQAGKRQLGRLELVRQEMSGDQARKGRPIGTFGAAWDDSGLHNETFWLGWAIVAEYSWSPNEPSLEQAVSQFVRLYYGPGVRGMDEVYRSLQDGARFWERSWQRVRSRVRGRSYGNSRGKGIGTQRQDMTLPLPQVPALPDLKAERAFSAKCAQTLVEARGQLAQNERLIYRLQENLARASRNRYNLEVFLALAYFQGHFVELLLGLEQAESDLLAAHKAHGAGRPEEAIAMMLGAHAAVCRLAAQGQDIYGRLKSVFEKSRYPKGRSVGGREFVHVMDDVKDHFADRRADLSFMMAPEDSLELDKWCEDLGQVIRKYADAHGLAVKAADEPIEE